MSTSPAACPERGSTTVRRLLLCLLHLALFAGPAALRAEDVLSEAQKRELIQERDRLGQEASALQANGKLDSAIDAARRMLEIERRVSGPKHPEVVAVLEYLSSLLRNRDDWKGAIAASQEVVAIDRALYGPKAWQSVSAERNVATLLAVAHFPSADCAQYRDALGKSNLARCLIGIRLYDSAATILREAIATLKPRTATQFDLAVCLTQLGNVELQRGHPADAAKILQDADGILANLLGNEHRDRLVTLHFLARARRDSGDLATARSLLERCLVARRKTMQRTNSILRDNVDDLANICRRQAVEALKHGQIASAVDDANRAEAIYAETFGSDDDRTIAPRIEATHLRGLAKLTPAQRDDLEQRMSQLARLSSSSKRSDRRQAVLFANATANVIDKRLGIADPLWVKCLETQRDQAIELDQLDAGVGFADVVCKHRAATFGRHHSETRASLDKLGEIQLRLAGQFEREGRFEDEEKELESSLATVQRAYGRENWRVAEAQVRFSAARRLARESKQFQQNYLRMRADYFDVLSLTGADRARAVPRLEEIRRYLARDWKGQHLYYAPCLQSLGSVALENGDLSLAGPLLQEALANRNRFSAGTILARPIGAGNSRFGTCGSEISELQRRIGKRQSPLYVEVPARSWPWHGHSTRWDSVISTVANWTLPSRF